MKFILLKKVKKAPDDFFVNPIFNRWMRHDPEVRLIKAKLGLASVLKTSDQQLKLMFNYTLKTFENKASCS